MIKYDTIYELFFDLIEKDKDFFQYNNVCIEDALMIAKQRAFRYLKESLSYLSLQCTPDKCGIDFSNCDDEKQVINEDLKYNELDLIANIMYERYLFREYSKLKAQANRFTMKDFTVFSPANERATFVSMYQSIKNDNAILIDHYLSINRSNGKTKVLDYTGIDE